MLLLYIIKCGKRGGASRVDYSASTPCGGSPWVPSGQSKFANFESSLICNVLSFPPMCLTIPGNLTPDPAGWLLHLHKAQIHYNVRIFMNYTFAAVVILAASLFASSSLMVFGGAFDTSAQMTEPAGERGAITGHVSLAIYDQSGNVKAYSQSGNTIVNSGENCIAEKLFDVGIASTCYAEINNDRAYHGNSWYIGNFTAIVLGTGTGTATTEHGSVTGLVSASSTKKGIISVTQTSSGANPDAPESKSVTDIVATFTAGATTMFSEAGLLNNNDVVLAYHDMTDKIVNQHDSLAVTWTITVG